MWQKILKDKTTGVALLKLIRLESTYCIRQYVCAGVSTYCYTVVDK